MRPENRRYGVRSRHPLQPTYGNRRWVFYQRYRKHKPYYRIFSYHRTLPSRCQAVRLFLNRHARSVWRVGRRRRPRRSRSDRRGQLRRPYGRHYQRARAELRRVGSGGRAFFFHLPCKPRARHDFHLPERVLHMLPH